MAIAREEFSTLAAWIAPCSVKARGSLRPPPRPGFNVAFCDIKAAYSAAERRNMKSSGQRSMLRLTANHGRCGACGVGRCTP
jgi:hypothetical protein